MVKSFSLLSCQVSNVTLVQVCWERFYASVKARMIKPVSVLAYFAFEPFRKLAQMINEFSVKVLNAPFNFAFVLRIRRMSKMRLNVMLTAPSFPLFFKLRSTVRKNSLRKPILLLQHSHCFSRRQLMVKLLRRNDKSDIIVDANQYFLTCTVNGPLKSICHSSSGASARKNFQRLNSR